MSRTELLEHYEFYLDNLQNNEIALLFELWKNEYQNELIKIYETFNKS
jgi:hypothetical protein